MPESKHDRDNFISFEEYVKYHEEFDFRHEFQVRHAFTQLMQRPTEQNVELGDSKIKAALEQLEEQDISRGITGDWSEMAPY